MGLAPKELTPLEQEKIKAAAEPDHNIKHTEKYQVICGIPPKKTDLSKIYVQPRSVMKVLMVLAKLIAVPPPHEYLPGRSDRYQWAKEPIKQWYPDIMRLEVLYRKDLPLPDLAEKPKHVFAAVKYKDYWFYIRDNDLASKDILSSMIAIFTMMPTGKKETPQLTLPVR
jgi:hypothetical protein